MKMTSNTRANGRPGTRRAGGFTLVELLLVLSILALLAGLVLPKLVGTKEKANIKAAIAQIGSFKTAIDLFEVDNGHYPAKLDELVTKPRNASADWHQYLDKVPLDPWGQAYIYVFPGRHNQNGFDLSSPGPDTQSGNEDDICNWDKPTR